MTLQNQNWGPLRSRLDVVEGD